LTGRIKSLDNAGAEISLFKEGALVGSGTIENFNAANHNILILGYTDNISYELPNFSLANLRIWKRALSD